MLDTLTEYTLPGQNSGIDIALTTKILIAQAERELEQEPERKTLLAERHLLAGDFDAVLKLQSPNVSPRVTVQMATYRGSREVAC
jgi:hypothetical protein